MLYDPKWEVKVTPWDLPTFIAWLETKPADVSYDFTQPSRCLIAQYLQHLGVARFALRGEEIPQPFHEIGNPGPRTLVNGGSFAFTFGGALDRARRFA